MAKDGFIGFISLPGSRVHALYHGIDVELDAEEVLDAERCGFRVLDDLMVFDE